MSDSIWKMTPQQVIDSPEVSILTFHNVYPEGKQGGLEIIQHGERVATNGDLRLEAAPGQWAILPAVKRRSVDPDQLQVSVRLGFAQPEINYEVHVWMEGPSIHLRVDLDQPLPENLGSSVGFNLELLPTAYFGKSYSIADSAGVSQFGIFPRQANGPLQSQPEDVYIPEPMAHGQKLVIAPEDPYRRITFEAVRGEIHLLDGRGATQNGWFIVRSEIPAGISQGAVEWMITPNRVSGWQREPIILISQVGYHPDQEKQALIELDHYASESELEEAALYRIQPEGSLEVVKCARPEHLGHFLRYQYARFDFSEVREPGMYQVRYGQKFTPPIKISQDVYQEGVWQPTLETFLPVQMCHVRVEDLYRVWHGACHLDDALQAPANHEHFDGYRQYAELETPYPELTHIPGLDRGGWHDAGDYDLATGSQANTTHILALAREAFGIDSDQTTVKPDERLVQIHVPDGIPDIVQQVRHGVEILLSGYHAAGHSFAGIIESNLKQYVHLGDAATMTDNLIYDPELPENTSTDNRSAKQDDRWAFTNHDTALEYQVAAALAASSRVLKGFEDELAAECLETAKGIWEQEHTHEPILQPGAYIPRNPKATEVSAAAELLICTGDERYAQRLIELWPEVEKSFAYLGWMVARVLPYLKDEAFQQNFRRAAEKLKTKLDEAEAASPFRLPFGDGWLRAAQPDHNPFAEDYYAPIWGIGWQLQSFAVQHYYLVKAFPDLFHRESLLRVLNYVLGWHPANNLSLVSGVGAQSLTIAYGVNRAEWSYTPGGIASGPALLRPDIIELLDPFPFLWQQKEYVIGGAATYIFLVLAADDLLNH